MNSQYAIAVHILTLISLYPHNARTSDEIAASVGVNPVVVRNVMSLLRKAGLLDTRQGSPGARLIRPPEAITLLDVYHAVNAPELVFKLHDQPHPQCPVGGNIQAALTTVLGNAQQAMEDHLATVTLADIMADLVQLAL
ncbi:Rrf2 family transcriptional regulator [Deinococcus deserti]|uniref:Putative transcriptional regulator, Rrf2 family n=1 Tax=Deinococcus deserti (strain DSM 17065 / CIP 109153 / LMG 22923 / VCD115) TaxID=546414 RepID=C1D3J8_DEIDV|nr:Rrf2 family transcriptional regulator [Deinococcus deserti]ACO48077.1 putative transcriptional regulator, Rrf2 family [Deinococcus deserti VCD115]